MERMRAYFAAAVVCVTGAACGNGPTEVVGGLTQAELEALAEVVGTSLVSSLANEDGPMAGPALAPLAAVRLQRELSFTADCALGGSLVVSGRLDANVDQAAGTGTLEYSLTQTHQECRVASEDGVVFTLTGAPHVTSSLVARASDQVLSVEGTYQGAVAWVTEEKEGLCSLSVELEIGLDLVGEATFAAMSGTVCGVRFSRTVSVD
jgi:hypothetical protein